MAKARSGVVTFHGKPVSLLGPKIKVGDRAPDFQCVGVDLEPVSLASTAGRVRLFSVVCSLDSSLCDQQTRRLVRIASEFPPSVVSIAVSSDLPFTQARWFTLADASHIQMYSDHRDASFGLAYGVLIKELRLLTRSVVVVDRSDVVRYIQIVPDVATLPNFEPVLRAVCEAI
jgi:thiol peroxidase